MLDVVWEVKEVINRVVCEVNEMIVKFVVVFLRVGLY